MAQIHTDKKKDKSAFICEICGSLFVFEALPRHGRAGVLWLTLCKFCCKRRARNTEKLNRGGRKERKGLAHKWLTVWKLRRAGWRRQRGMLRKINMIRGCVAFRQHKDIHRRGAEGPSLPHGWVVGGGDRDLGHQGGD